MRPGEKVRELLVVLAENGLRLHAGAEIRKLRKAPVRKRGVVQPDAAVAGMQVGSHQIGNKDQRRASGCRAAVTAALHRLRLDQRLLELAEVAERVDVRGRKPLRHAPARARVLEVVEVRDVGALVEDVAGSLARQAAEHRVGVHDEIVVAIVVDCPIRNERAEALQPAAPLEVAGNDSERGRRVVAGGVEEAHERRGGDHRLDARQHPWFPAPLDGLERDAFDDLEEG